MVKVNSLVPGAGVDGLGSTLQEAAAETNRGETSTVTKRKFGLYRYRLLEVFD